MWLDWAVIFCIYLFRGELLQLFPQPGKPIPYGKYIFTRHLCISSQWNKSFTFRYLYCAIAIWNGHLSACCGVSESMRPYTHFSSWLQLEGRFFNPDVTFWLRTTWWERMIGPNKSQGEIPRIRLPVRFSRISDVTRCLSLIYTDCSGWLYWRVNKLIAGVFLGMRWIEFWMENVCDTMSDLLYSSWQESPVCTFPGQFCFVSLIENCQPVRLWLAQILMSIQAIVKTLASRWWPKNRLFCMGSWLRVFKSPLPHWPPRGPFFPFSTWIHLFFPGIFILLGQVWT